MTEIYFAKTKTDAIIPTKRDEDAGYDIYACFDDDFMIIEPHTTSMIPTGIACCCPTGYCLILKERGSTGTKGMAQRCGIIDSGYRDSIFVPITNTTNKRLVITKKSMSNTFKDHEEFIVYPYEKAITQGLIVPVPKTKSIEISYDELKTIPSERGIGKLGSSSK